LGKGIDVKNLSRRLSELQQYTRNAIHDLSDGELARRIKDLEKRKYAISTAEQLKAKIQEIEEVIQRKTGQGFK
jgi:hypothetical protein